METDYKKQSPVDFSGVTNLAFLLEAAGFFEVMLSADLFLDSSAFIRKKQVNENQA